MFVRRLSDMAILYEDQEAVKRALGAGDDPVVYRGHQAGVPESPGHLAFMTTTIAAGTVGSEFYMTKGHYHVQDSGEMYLGLSGHGIMVMESREGEFADDALSPAVAVYVPPGWGPPHREHRSRAALCSGQLLCRRRARLRLCRAVRVFSAGIPRRERPAAPAAPPGDRDGAAGVTPINAELVVGASHLQAEAGREPLPVTNPANQEIIG